MKHLKKFKFKISRFNSTDSIVEKAGIEQYLEEKLQGTEGEREVIVNKKAINNSETKL